MFPIKQNKAIPSGDSQLSAPSFVMAQSLGKSRGYVEDAESDEGPGPHTSYSKRKNALDMESSLSSTMSRQDLAFDRLLEKVSARGFDYSAELSCKNVSFSIPVTNGQGRKMQKTILHPFCTVIQPGSLVAIMGPSGSGKTTLMDILADKKTTPFSGIIYVNGRPRERAFFKRISSYMPQYDYGSGLETVYESVRFVATLKSDTLDHLTLRSMEEEEEEEDSEGNAAELGRQGSSSSSAVEKDPIRIILKALGLSKVADMPIGNELVRGISGGQSRRAALARAIICFPALFFADEPTSGLSATDSEIIMSVLSKLCSRLRMSCIASIHQPRESIFQMFDHLVLMSAGGQCVYNGPCGKAQSFFKSMGYAIPPGVNPPDWYMDVISKSPKAFRQEYRERLADIAQRDVATAIRTKGKSEQAILKQFGREPSKNRLSLCEQTMVLTSRSLRLMFRNANTLTMMSVHKIFMGVFIGLVYFDIGNQPENITYQITFLFSLMLAVAASAMQSIGELVEDRYTMQMEMGEGLYSPFPYMISRMSKSILIAFIGNIILVMVSYFLAGFTGLRVFLLFALGFALFLAIDSIVSFIVAMTSGVQSATSYSILALTILGVFNGFTANTVSSPDFINFISYVSPYYWTFCGGINVMFNDFNFTQTPTYPSYDALLDTFGYPQGFEFNSLGINLAIAVYFRILQYLALTFVTTLKI